MPFVKFFFTHEINKFIQKLFKNPISDFNSINLKDWFPSSLIKKKRQDIKIILQNLYKDQKNSKNETKTANVATPIMHTIKTISLEPSYIKSPQNEVNSLKHSDPFFEDMEFEESQHVNSHNLKPTNNDHDDDDEEDFKGTQAKKLKYNDNNYIINDMNQLI